MNVTKSEGKKGVKLLTSKSGTLSENSAHAEWRHTAEADADFIVKFHSKIKLKKCLAESKKKWADVEVRLLKTNTGTLQAEITSESGVRSLETED